jgi:Sulfotransferase domain
VRARYAGHNGQVLSDHGTPVPVVFIGGSGRTGSTLIERLLGQLPGVCNVGEVVFLWERGLQRGERCGCGSPLPECPFWRKVGERAFGGWDSFGLERFLALKQSIDRNRFVPLLAARSPGANGEAMIRAREYAGTYALLYRAIREISGCPIIVDSSKHASLAFCLRTAADIDLRVVHVVRDSRAVAYSWTRRVRRPEADVAATDAQTHMDTFSPGKSAMVWNALNLGFHLLAARGIPATLIRYEDFVAAPVTAMHGLAEFAGAKPELSFMTGEHADLAAAHSASGNPMRFAAGRTSFRLDDEWRTRLGRADRALVTALTLPLLARYGYLRRA